jgi:magnesium-transporting ATPase (P-type)
MGFVFIGSTGNEINLRFKTQDGWIDKQVFLIQSFKFNSARKRMSVIIKDGNNYKLYVKGADNIIKQRLKKGEQKYLDNIV